MKLALRQLPIYIRGDVRMKFLAPDATAALVAVEKDTDGLDYTDMWRDPTSCLVARRKKKTSQLPGFSAHNFGLAVDLDVKKILDSKKIHYEDLLHIMKKRGWICHRRDGDGERPDSCHFAYLGDDPNLYLSRCNLDPITWHNAAEQRILERFGSHFQMSIKEIQHRLSELRFYSGPFTGQVDVYTREAIFAFQRAWDLVANGHIDNTLCRALAFITADLEMS